jgi:hypothetical protein
VRPRRRAGTARRGARSACRLRPSPRASDRTLLAFELGILCTSLPRRPYPVQGLAGTAPFCTRFIADEPGERACPSALPCPAQRNTEYCNGWQISRRFFKKEYCNDQKSRLAGSRRSGAAERAPCTREGVLAPRLRLLRGVDLAGWISSTARRHANAGTQPSASAGQL